ncbi:Regulator of nonsense transcripts UPF3 [Escovopsis weberi]|uniref:Regulator of nonsense transcripts UPF3 n=1 Tax=Escovopsis weberi TaxID=150374 RepID=A0A0M8N896_ESCWE|nr:Regulator of nonsense transcripts UPF3 [Escovopsis weberi]
MEKKGKAAIDSGAVRPARGKGASDKGSEAKNTNDPDAPKSSRTKAPSEGEKLVIRRLPPGMTQDEFVSILGHEWETGNGKVDWFYYVRGKISNDEVIRASSWEDAKNTYMSPSLVGPPSLEFSAYKKIPGSRKRTDARQGTIDQDPEFMAFLEGLANPTPVKEGPEHEEGEDGGKPEVTTTPLIEYLKEKKANKIKEAAAAKSAKHSRLEASSKGRASAKESEGSGRKGKDSKCSKSEKGPSKENVKILTKKAAVEQAAETAKTVASQISNAGPSTSAGTKTAAAAASSTSAEPAPKNRRAGIAQAARILQRDLGLSPGSAHRRARQDAAKADTDPKTTPSSSSNNNSSSSRSNANAPSGSRTGFQQKAAPSAKKNASSAPANIGRGFVKHANASQGISETALRQALEAFGTITSIEVDKRKGFAYVDFADHASLVKAISGSPLNVAQGTVSIMERKDKKPAAAAAAAAAAATSASAASGSGSAAGTAPAAPEKSTSRGRRGRGGGGNKNHPATNGNQAADASATNGPG